MINQPSYLKQARKLADLSLSDIAFIIDVDVSSLSKYENGKADATLPALLSYHIITGIPLSKLFQHSIGDLGNEIQHRVNNLIEQLEAKIPNRKVNSRIASLGRILEIMSTDNE